MLGHTFVGGLDETSKMNLDSACRVSCMARPYSEIQLLLNNFTTNDHNLQGDGESRRTLKQKAAGYAKYIKDIVAHKRRFTELETVLLTEECTSRVQNKFHQKLKDPCSFTILVRIGNIDVGSALYDLEARINLMTLSLFKQLSVGAPRPTTVMLQLVDWSIAYPEAVIEDVLLQIMKFIFPADFTILYYEADKQVIHLPRLYEELLIISVAEVDEKSIDTSLYLDDSLEIVLMFFDSLEIDDEVEMRPNGLPLKPLIEEAHKLELKPLPPHLQYAYLGGSDILHVIVSSDLSKLLEAKAAKSAMLLEKYIPFKLDDACLKEFEELKGRLVTVPIIITPDWAQPFELMCDVSDISIGVVLGQKRDTNFHTIYYEKLFLNLAQMNYIVTEKELFAVVWVFDKFRSYLIGTKAIVYTNHSAIRLENRNHVAKGGSIKETIADEQLLVPKNANNHEMPLQNILAVEIFEVWGFDFMAPFPYSTGHRYILLVVNYMSKWVEAMALPTNDANVVVNFVQKHIFIRLKTQRVLISDGATHFYKKLLNNVLAKYGIKHKVVTAYHPQTSGQVEVSNIKVKQIIETTVC
nr:uncharacterized protein LOC104088728 [Nicotiana tomentosiformis]